MSRKFASISVDELKAKIDAVVGKFGGLHTLIKQLGKDIKVSFDLENSCYDKGCFGPQSLMGYNVLENGLAFCGMCAGGDWEQPVFFCVYWDGKKLRGYVPTDGNLWNTKTKEAYGNDEDADIKDIRKRYPDRFEDDEEPDVECLDFEEDLILKDMLSRITKA